MTRILILPFLFFGGFSFAQTELIKYKAKIESIRHQIELTGDPDHRLAYIADSLRQLMHLEMMHFAGIPKGNFKDSAVFHQHYILSYNEKHEQANWVMHVLSPEIEGKNYGRTIPFSTDSLIKSGTAVKEDYDFPEYDRGHLAPSADFRWSVEAKNESYLSSNISPMIPEVNRVTWMEIENSLREFVIKSHHHLLVVTGPVLQDSLPKTGAKNQISVPNYFFKTVLDLDDTLHPVITFLVPNRLDALQIQKKNRIIKLLDLELVTGFAFFPEIRSKLDFYKPTNLCALHRYFYEDIYGNTLINIRK